jgi:rhodanese-related sulfurtransferase
MAGATGVAPEMFVLWDSIGAALWAGIGLALGRVFAPVVADLLLVLEQMGKWGLLFLAAWLACSITSKLWRRRQFLAQLRMDRISVPALAHMLERGEAPMVVDVRPPSARIEGWIPGAIGFYDEPLAQDLHSANPEAFVVVYCDCPNEASAARTAKKLMERGFRRVRPLEGGLAAWRAAGHALERTGAWKPAPITTEHRSPP